MNDSVITKLAEFSREHNCVMRVLGNVVTLEFTAEPVIADGVADFWDFDFEEAAKLEDPSSEASSSDETAFDIKAEDPSSDEIKTDDPSSEDPPPDFHLPLRYRNRELIESLASKGYRKRELIDVSPYFSLPQDEAARLLGLGTASLLSR